MSNKNNDSPSNPSRRNLLKNAGLVGAAVAGGGGVGSMVGVKDGSHAQAAVAVQPVREALEVLTALEAETLEAITDRILPSDESGPGAREARAVHYIDRSLAADNASSRASYASGLAAIDDLARQKHGRAFHLLDPQVQDELLQAVIDGEGIGFNPSGSGFFSMVRNHTIDGTFSDPYYGGNRNFIGWDMLHYPGVRFSVSESDIALGRNLAPAHQSAYDMPAFTKLIATTGGSGNGN